MDVHNLTRDAVREILRASQGIPTQLPDSKAYVKDGRVQSSKMGHAISDHLHSASLAAGKTKFISLDDMVEALWQVLHSPPGVSTVKNLKTGQRDTIRSAFKCLPGLRAARRAGTRCQQKRALCSPVKVIESRAKGRACGRTDRHHHDRPRTNRFRTKRQFTAVHHGLD